MPRPKSKVTDPWHLLLQKEIQSGNTATPEHRSFKQIQAMRKSAGLAPGQRATYEWLKKLKAEKKIRADDFYVLRGGRKVRDIRYIFT